MKIKGDIFYFEAGKYVVGDLMNLFEDKIAKQMKSTFSKLKSKCGLNGKYNLHYFKCDGDRLKDYIDKSPEIITKVCLLIVPEKDVKSGRLNNCKRLNAKNKFSVRYLNDNLGTVIYFTYIDDPSPFMMLVHERTD